MVLTKAGKSKYTKKNGKLTFAEKRRKATKNKHKKKVQEQESKNSSPPHAQLKSLYEHYQNRRYRDAEKSAISITKQFPHHSFSWKVLGEVLKQTGRIADALVVSKKAVQLAPQDAEALNNLGTVFHQLGRSKDAEMSYRRAIDLESDFFEAHSNLGNTLKELGRFEDAINSCVQALIINPEFEGGYYNLGNALKGVRLTRPEPDLPRLILTLLEKETIARPVDISGAVTSLIKLDPIVQRAMNKYLAGEFTLDETIADLSTVSLLLKLMAICPIPDLELENLLRNIRAEILLNIAKIRNNPATLSFQIALALQCFANEYVYDVTEAETEAIKKLQKLIKEKLRYGQQPNLNELACIGSYTALHEYSWSNLLTDSAELEELKSRLIFEPEEEKKLGAGIPRLKEISDPLSSKVKEQYEKSPYPRWVNLGLSFSPKSAVQTANDFKLRVPNKFSEGISAPQILVAGCGTGQQSISTATRFRNCDVLAIDLSLSSLSYAQRKTHELGIKNIKYMQGDILDLGKINRQFDIVESTGVLHHMSDPISGWRVLVDCLKPGGLMFIGLYSELARHHIVKIREETKEMRAEFDTQSMRSFRNYLIKSNAEHHKKILASKDSYSLSMFRDLLFHVQEHRFSIPKIKDSLDTLGLYFCGFQNDKITSLFKAQNPAPDDLYNLEIWNEFEYSQPDTFAGMYQFWCQKS